MDRKKHGPSATVERIGLSNFLEWRRGEARLRGGVLSAAPLGRQGCNEPRWWRWDLLAAVGELAFTSSCAQEVVVVVHTGLPLNGMDSPVSGST